MYELGICFSPSILNHFIIFRIMSAVHVAEVTMVTEPKRLDDRLCDLQGGQCSQATCCVNHHYVGSLCHLENEVCCLDRVDCSNDDRQGN